MHRSTPMHFVKPWSRAHTRACAHAHRSHSHGPHATAMCTLMRVPTVPLWPCTLLFAPKCERADPHTARGAPVLLMVGGAARGGRRTRLGVRVSGASGRVSDRDRRSAGRESTATGRRQRVSHRSVGRGSRVYLWPPNESGGARIELTRFGYACDLR